MFEFHLVKQIQNSKTWFSRQFLRHHQKLVLSKLVLTYLILVVLPRVAVFHRGCQMDCPFILGSRTHPPSSRLSLVDDFSGLVETITMSYHSLLSTCMMCFHLSFGHNPALKCYCTQFNCAISDVHLIYLVKPLQYCFA